MPIKQLLLLLPIVATLSTLTVHFNHQSALAMSATEIDRQQSGRETAQANSLQNSKTENWLPRGIAVFIVGGHIIYSRQKQPK
jgi:hypothetical protein